jgi:hypothetical protein
MRAGANIVRLPRAQLPAGGCSNLKKILGRSKRRSKGYGEAARFYRLHFAARFC